MTLQNKALRSWGEVVLDLVGYSAGIFAGRRESEGFLEVLLRGGGVIVMEVGAGESEVGLGAGVEADGGYGLVAGFGESALQG